jgi:DNA-directed RNA polymerase omega subunit
MTKKEKTPSPSAGHGVVTERWPGIDSSYRLIILAAKRSKQLLDGSVPRIEADQSRRRNTSIALEETKRGLVPFRIIDKKKAAEGAETAE